MAITFAAFERVKASKLQLLADSLPAVVVKANSPARTNSTLAADSELVLPVVSGRSYGFRGLLLVSGISSAAQDFKFGFDAPTGSILRFTGHGPYEAWGSGAGARDGEWATVTATTFPSGALPVGTITGTIVGVRFWGNLEAGGTGSLTLHWAQATTHATGTTLNAGSEMEIWGRS